MPITPNPIYTVIPTTNHSSMFEEQFAWCERQFGKFRDVWNYDIMTNTYKFKNSQDAMLFKLRWS